MSDQLDLVLGALAEPTRRSLFLRLVTDGPETATSLSSGLPVTRQAITKHLQVLTAAGLLRRIKVGREVRFEAEPAALDDAVSWMTDAGAAWDRRLDRLRGSLQTSGGRTKT